MSHQHKKTKKDEEVHIDMISKVVKDHCSLTFLQVDCLPSKDSKQSSSLNARNCRTERDVLLREKKVTSLIKANKETNFSLSSLPLFFTLRASNTLEISFLAKLEIV